MLQQAIEAEVDEFRRMGVFTPNSHLSMATFALPKPFFLTRATSLANRIDGYKHAASYGTTGMPLPVVAGSRTIGA